MRSKDWGVKVMKNIPIWFVAFLGLSLFSFLAAKSIYNDKDNVILREETLQGDISAMDGIELNLTFTDYGNLRWDVDLNYNQGIESNVVFNPMYGGYTHSSDKRQMMIIGDNVSDEIERHINEMDIGRKELKIADYVDYMSVKLAMLGQGRFEFEGENNLYKIKIPESALAIVEKEYNSTSIEYRDILQVMPDLPSVIIGDRMFFTIPNLEMSNLNYYQYYEYEDIEYSLKSGILSVPLNEKRSGKILYSEINTHYPLDLDHNSSEYIIGMEVVTDEELLALITLEDNKIYAHIYDHNNDRLIIKKEISQISEGDGLRYVSINSQEDYLLIHYEYSKEDSIFEEEDYYYLAEAYEIKDDDIIKLIGNEYLHKLDSEYASSWYIEENGLYYGNNKIYLVSRDHRLVGNNNTGLLLMAIDNDDVLYFASIANSMEEDYTIATTGVDGSMLVYSRDRYLDKYEFIFNY